MKKKESITKHLSPIIFDDGKYITCRMTIQKRILYPNTYPAPITYVNTSPYNVYWFYARFIREHPSVRCYGVVVKIVFLL